MTPFTKENLVKDGMYLLYGSKREFVARFKWKGPVTMAQFKKELIRSHTVEGYFEKYNQGKAPLEILKEANPTWYQQLADKWLARH